MARNKTKSEPKLKEIRAIIAAKSLGLNSRAQFAVKKIFALDELKTVEDWKKTFKKKEIT